MTYEELKTLCQKGKIGMIPGWQGYVKYDYINNQLYLVNGDYIMPEKELKSKIINRTDLYYII